MVVACLINLYYACIDKKCLPGMALCIPQPFYYHCAGRVEISQTVFHGTIQELRVWWGVHHGFAYVLSGAVYMALPGECIRSQVFHLLRVVCEN